MEGVVRRGRRLLRGGNRAQATIEFAFSAPLLLLCLFATVDAAAWALQNSAAVAAVEEGARLAASAAGTPLGHQAPNAVQVTDGVVAQLRSAMFATSVRPWCDPAPGAACSAVTTPQARCRTAGCRFQQCPASPNDVEAAFGPRVIAVCVHENDPAPCTAPATPTSPGVPAYCDDSPTVSVRVVGFMASLVPPSFGLGWHGGEIPIDVGATTHTLRFAP
jgi:hypothetical protein